LRPTPVDKGSGVCEPQIDGHGAVPLSNRSSRGKTLAALRVDGARLKFDRLGLPFGPDDLRVGRALGGDRAWWRANVAAFSWFLRRDHGRRVSTINARDRDVGEDDLPAEDPSRPSRLILPCTSSWIRPTISLACVGPGSAGYFAIASGRRCGRTANEGAHGENLAADLRVVVALYFV